MGSKATLSQEEVYERYAEKVLAYIRYRVSTKEDAEDLQSNVFLKVFRQWDRYESEKASISTWIYTIARNEVIDYYRTRHVAEEIPEDFRDASQTEEEVIENEELDELADALMQLEQKERDLIVLHYYEKKTLRSIAEMMDLSYDQTKNVHYKALKQLRKIMKPDL